MSLTSTPPSCVFSTVIFSLIVIESFTLIKEIIEITIFSEKEIESLKTTSPNCV